MSQKTLDMKGTFNKESKKKEKEEKKRIEERKKELRNIGFTIATKRFRCEKCGTLIPEGFPYLTIKKQPIFTGGRMLHISDKYCPKCQIKMELKKRKEKRGMVIEIQGSNFPICWKCGGKLKRFIEYVVAQRVELICENGHNIKLKEEWRKPLGIKQSGRHL